VPVSPVQRAVPDAPSGVVSLTTDFGQQDPFAGLVKARILGSHPAARIIDLTHGVAPFSTEAAAFWVERSYRYFPPGSLHLVIVDPGVGTDRRILAVAADKHFFLGPDNGVLAPLAAREGARVRAVAMGSLEAYGIAKPSPTFHGRDVFAPLAGGLSSGKLSFDELGLPCENWLRADWPVPEADTNKIRGRIVLVDSFGNCFSNIEAELINTYEVSSVTFGAHRLPWRRTYAEAPAGSGLALINAFGVLEAACAQGNAARQFGLAPGAQVLVELGGPRAGHAGANRGA
jgi:S-adenosylmethionine hydrolase